MNKQILSKAKKIIQKEEKEYLYISTCLKARICPKCGIELEELEKNIFTFYECPNCHWEGNS